MVRCLSTGAYAACPPVLTARYTAPVSPIVTARSLIVTRRAGSSVLCAVNAYPRAEVVRSGSDAETIRAGHLVVERVFFITVRRRTGCAAGRSALRTTSAVSTIIEEIVCKVAAVRGCRHFRTQGTGSFVGGEVVVYPGAAVAFQYDVSASGCEA